MMNNENSYQPHENSDVSNGNNGDFKRKRTRINTERNNHRSFNPNFYRENRPYKPSARNENGEYSPQNSGNNYRPRTNDHNSHYNNNKERNFNNYGSEQRPQRNYDNSEQRPQRNYNNSERPQRNYNNSERPQRSYGSNNQDEHFKPRDNNYGNRSNYSGNRYQNGERRQNYNQNGDFQRRPQGNSYKKPNYGERFNRSENYNPNDKYSRKKQFEYKQQFVDYSKPMRLNKFLANSSACSRREADEFIVAGVIKVNGEVVTELGTKIIPATDKVHFHDQPVALEKKVYILLNKPKNCVTTSDDPQERLTVLNLVKNACSERVYPVGRLDRNTTGVLLLTNDGDLTSKLTHPKHDRKKIYQVRLDRDFSEIDMQSLLDGIVLQDGEIKADNVSFVKEDDLRTVGIEIHSGKNRIVRRMFEQLNYRIVSLDRVYFAGLTKKNLPRGKWRYLSEVEVNMLKMSNN